MDDFFVLGDFIGSMITRERPFRILEISSGGTQYGHLLKTCQQHCGLKDGVVDRLAMSGIQALSENTVYGRVFDEVYLENPYLLDRYDFVLVINALEHMEPQKARSLLDVLQHKIMRQALIITPLDSGEGYRKYHPLVFLGLDFSFSMIQGVNKAMQAFSVFPKIPYETMAIDHIPAQEATEKLTVSFALPHHIITGGMKALLQQIRHLKRCGHIVNVYFRSDSSKSAIPFWSDLTDEDCSNQFVIPTSERFCDHIQDADVVMIAGIDQALEFANSKIPVVLWEQGYEPMFGEFGAPLHSRSYQRLYFHSLYRLPIHLLSVSNVIATVLKGVYNRDAFVYPNGIDAAFYHPAEKNNEIPIVLLTGHPALAFKGFRFAFDVLHRAYVEGLRFQVKWAAQVKVIHGKTAFPLEVVISPSQHELANMYRTADIFLSTSLYESYALPPLEAMASGTAVIATDCGGIRSYARHEENCILCRQGDIKVAADALKLLISNPGERQRLALAGRETALLHSAETVVQKLAQRLFSIVLHDRQSRAAETMGEGT